MAGCQLRHSESFSIICVKIPPQMNDIFLIIMHVIINPILGLTHQKLTRVVSEMGNSSRLLMLVTQTRYGGKRRLIVS
jgi:hypothetical protein